LTHDELSRSDLLANVLETLLALVVFSLASRPRHGYDYSSSPQRRFCNRALSRQQAGVV
jgi:hypothetical protein